jgi:hypothetical protein
MPQRKSDGSVRRRSCSGASERPSDASRTRQQPGVFQGRHAGGKQGPVSEARFETGPLAAIDNSDLVPMLLQEVRARQSDQPAADNDDLQVQRDRMRVASWAISSSVSKTVA